MVGGLLLVIVLSSAPTQKTHLPETTHLIDSIQGPALYRVLRRVPRQGREGRRPHGEVTQGGSAGFGAHCYAQRRQVSDGADLADNLG